MNNIIDTNEKQASKPAKEKDLFLVRIPKDPLNKSDENVVICINSKKEMFERGKDYKVTLSVKKLLEKAMYI